MVDGQMAEWVSFLHYSPAASPSVSCLFLISLFWQLEKKKKRSNTQTCSLFQSSSG